MITTLIVALSLSIIPLQSALPDAPQAQTETAPEKPYHTFTTPGGILKVDDEACDRINDDLVMFILPDGNFSIGSNCAEAVARMLYSRHPRPPRA